MKIKKNSAFTLIETMIAMAISVICVAAIYYSYLFVKNSYEGLENKTVINSFGRDSLSKISKDLRNAGYHNINYTSPKWDREIEQKNNYNNTNSDLLIIWYNSSAKDRLKISYYLKKDQSTNAMSLVRDQILNPKVKNQWGYGLNLNCSAEASKQTNCQPKVVVPYVTDFQVVLKDKNGSELTNVCGSDSCSAIGRGNQSKVYTAEVYLTVRSKDEVYEKNKKTRIINHNSSTGKDQTLSADRYLRETFFISVHTRNLPI